MSKISFVFLFFLPFFCTGQVNESFSDGNFTENPKWEGMEENFIVNESFQLQSKAETASSSFLFTPSEAFDNAVWECWIKIDYATSPYNYVAFYLTSDRKDSIDNCNAYYVQIGGANDEISLFCQQGTRKTKIIAGQRKRIDFDSVEVHVKVSRSSGGNFVLYSRLAAEEEFVKEGEAENTAIRRPEYTGLLFSNSGETGNCYFFDDISVSGDKVIDKDAPEWLSLEAEEAGILRLAFSEPMNFSEAIFEVDNAIGYPQEQFVSPDGSSVELRFPFAFEKGIVYSLKTEYLTDKSGNALAEPEKIFGIPEAIEVGDVIINEIMFDAPEGSFEYIEIMNVSNKLLDASELVFTTRKADGSLNAGQFLANRCFLKPQGYLAVSEDAETLRQHHACPDGSHIRSIKWTLLNNEESVVVLTDREKEIVHDELAYSSKWHHPLIRDAKGVALERISPYSVTQSSDSWHSASSETNYGTPGYRNSQYRGITLNQEDDRLVRLEPEAFSPDNDGVEDVCFIYYQTPEAGYSANIIIFDMAGVEVRRLASNAILSAEGFFTWDGTLSNHSNANSGVYALYFEMFHPQKGVSKRIKKPVVVSGR